MSAVVRLRGLPTNLKNTTSLLRSIRSQFPDASIDKIELGVAGTADVHFSNRHDAVKCARRGTLWTFRGEELVYSLISAPKVAVKPNVVDESRPTDEADSKQEPECAPDVPDGDNADDTGDNKPAPTPSAVIVDRLGLGVNEAILVDAIKQTLRTPAKFSVRIFRDFRTGKSIGRALVQFEQWQDAERLVHYLEDDLDRHISPKPYDDWMYAAVRVRFVGN